MKALVCVFIFFALFASIIDKTICASYENYQAINTSFFETNTIQVQNNYSDVDPFNHCGECLHHCSDKLVFIFDNNNIIAFSHYPIKRNNFTYIPFNLKITLALKERPPAVS